MVKAGYLWEWTWLGVFLMKRMHWIKKKKRTTLQHTHSSYTKKQILKKLQREFCKTKTCEAAATADLNALDQVEHFGDCDRSDSSFV